MNDLYNSPPRKHWRIRRMIVIPLLLSVISLLLILSHSKGKSFIIGTYVKVAFKIEEPEPMVLEPLPPQDYTFKWPPDLNQPLCMPKIYVYPDDARMGEFQVSGIEGVGTNYMSEQILLSQLRDKSSDVYRNYVTEKPEEADFFYIPFLGAKYLTYCWFGKGIKGDCDVDELYVKPMMRHIQEDYPYWNRTFGRDHIITHPMDSTSLYYNARHTMQNATFLTTIGDKRVKFTNEGRARRYDDIVIPSSTALLHLAKFNPLDYVTEDGHPKKGSRDVFVIFGGLYKDVKPADEYSGGIRSLIRALEHQYGYKVAAHWESPDYSNLLSRAKYGLAPQGWTLDTTRIWEYIAFGVVPVVIADGIVEPFEDDLDWDSFIVRIPRRNAHKMDLILRSISDEEYESKRQALWDHGRHTLFDQHAWDLIVRGLCRKGGLAGLRTIDRDHHEALPQEFTI
ncbi:hypothetical protein BG011_002643 [Mortierella polycephala]|uniref:Exostosin GT47 domain-containing protein n=1 Tax=Mortierella polycephala TaxID=41804 RepID=A0A9P6Q626_9FUNG|nr:hypothetical protein BG011_002643 [Mortierella polycephala]